MGVDPGDAGSGHGLDSMRERAEELNGCLRWDASAGTALIADLPLVPSASAERPLEPVPTGSPALRADPA